MEYKDSELGVIPRHWEISKIEDVLEKIIDYRGKTPKKSKHGIPMLSARTVKMGYIDYDNVYYISKEEYDKFMVRGIPLLGDILITTEAPLGCIARLNKINVGIAQRLLTVRGREGVLNNNYLMYYLMSKVGQHELYSRETGTTVTGIKQSQFRKIKIILPSLSEQQKIAHILFTIDSKIELNNKLKENLQELSQALYKQWFVDFEFPNKEGLPYKSNGGKMVKSELGMTPDGWEVISLNNITNVINGYSYSGKELVKSNIGMATIKNFDRNGGFKINGFKDIIPEKEKSHHYIKMFDLLVAHTDLTQNAEIIGNPILVLNTAKYDKVIISMDLVKVSSKKENIGIYYLYEILKSMSFKNHALSYTSGTTVLHLNKKCIGEYKIALSNDDLIYKFNKATENNYKKLVNLIIEDNSMIKLRDVLLPKLMSGEIDLENIDL